MRKFYRYDLTIFDEGAEGGAEGAAAGTPAEGAQKVARGVQPAGGYSYAQAEEIATARAQKAERAALASYFKQQGLNEEQVTDAIKAYKAAQKAKEPDVATLTKERDEARAKVAAYEQQDALAKKGVKTEYADFVAFKVRDLMAKDKTLDTFDKAADKFIKDNPQYSAGTRPAYRVKNTANAEAGGSQTKTDDKTAARAALNAAIKSAARRGK